jgi:hypothetical protein
VGLALVLILTNAQAVPAMIKSLRTISASAMLAETSSIRLEALQLAELAVRTAILQIPLLHATILIIRLPNVSILLLAIALHLIHSEIMTQSIISMETVLKYVEAVFMPFKVR